MQQIKTDKTPLHLQAQYLLRRLIEAGTYQPGERLPSEVGLATQLGISRPTLREALLRLEQEGVIVRRHGVGTFVSSCIPVLDWGLEVLESLESKARRIGLHTQVTNLSVAERPATPQELAMLLLSPDDPVNVLSVDRVMVLGGKPVAYLKDIVPQTYLRREDLEEQFSGSVLDIMLQRGTPPPISSRTEIIAEAAKTEIAAKLSIPRGTALLKLTGQLYSQDQQVLDYTLGYFVPGHFNFHVIRRVNRGQKGYRSKRW